MQNNKKPKISVLIPVYNAGEFLSLCLSSLEKQTFSDFEVICLNDGSTDNSLSVLENMAKKDTRFRFFTQKNAGVAATRNRLLQLARGEYIAFVDSDDWIEKNYLESLYSVAEQTQADLVKCFFKEFNTLTQEIQRAHCSSLFFSAPKNSFSSRICHGYYDSVVWGKLWRLECLFKHKILFLEGFVAEDFAWVSLAFAFADKIEICPKEIYIYRKGLTDAITSDSEKMMIGKLKNVLFLLKDLEERKLLDKETLSFLLKLIIWNLCVFRKQPKEKAKESLHLQQEALGLVDKFLPLLPFNKRIRFLLWRLLAGKPLTWKFYFWSKIFR